MTETQRKTCRNCGEAFDLSPDDLGFYEKMGTLPPTFCPRCRLQRRMLFRNERTLYRRACDLCKRSMIAMYPADAPFPVYCQKCWWSDNWDAFDHGRELDLNRPFFEQARELFLMVPALGIQNDDGIASTNSEYANDFGFSKNCYMTAAGWYSENVLYSYYTCYDKDVMDCWLVNNSELMYQCLDSDKSFGCGFCKYLKDCRNCWFSFNMKNCSDCFLSSGLRGKSYYILNQPYSKEEYQEKLKEFNISTREGLEKCAAEAHKLAMALPRKAPGMLQSVNCTGNDLYYSKNAHESFFSYNLENCGYMFFTNEGKESLDCHNTGQTDFCYECVTPDQSYADMMDIFCWRCNHVDYSNNCHGAEYLFGCAGVKKGAYAILNRRYSKEEYLALRGKLIAQMTETGEWGEFFSKDVSPFAYNESQAQEWFPLSKEEALARGYRWRDPEEKSYPITIPAREIPAGHEDIPADILDAVLGCAHEGKCAEKCSTAFKVVPQELQFYRKLKLPLPVLCPNCRHYERLKKTDPIRLIQHPCMCRGKESAKSRENITYRNVAPHAHGEEPCGRTLESVFGPDRPEIAYCEDCYHSEVN